MKQLIFGRAIEKEQVCKDLLFLNLMLLSSGRFSSDIQRFQIQESARK